ncbi:MAG TPA: hypothetical protein VKN35_13895, partial [Xanthomonadales bacterium]|nr:hypothetical protein [Xanthomonadales bacterium]
MQNRLILLLLLAFSGAAAAQVVETMDLNTVTTNENLIFRLLGSVGDGAWGVPVAGGFDMDGDEHNDFAMAAF